MPWELVTTESSNVQVYVSVEDQSARTAELLYEEMYVIGPRKVDTDSFAALQLGPVSEKLMVLLF